MTISLIQQEIIEDLGITSEFNVATETGHRINFLKDYLRETGMRSYVLGISGGVDSTVAGTLAQTAVSELNNEGYTCEFIAVRLPYITQVDEYEAQLALNFIQPDDSQTVNIGSATDVLFYELYMNNSPSGVTTAQLDLVKGNIKARQRMIAQYAIAGLNKGLVIGTDHGAEAVMGFFTKYGDGAADILPLAGLNKRRVRAIGTYLGVPINLVDKVPTADLEDNRPQLPDEVAHGVTYDQIDDFLEGKDVGQQAHDIIVKAYHNTRHKRALPVAYGV